jgi:hypothetical protein
MTMTRFSYRPPAALCLVLGLLAYVGCSTSPTSEPNKATPTGTAERKTTGAGGSAGAGAKGTLFAGWPTPAAALLISGEQFGYLEPCGCTQGQQGGLKRRYDLIERLREEGKWSLALIDLGSLIKDPGGARGGFDQAKLTFQVALKALGLMKYDGLALSAEDLKVGTDEALMQFVNTLKEPTKVLCANVVPAAGFEATIRPKLRTEAGRVAIGITAVIDPEALNRLADPSRSAMLPVVKAPEEVLPDILADLEKDTKVQVLMVQGPPEMARELGKKFPGFDVVVGTSVYDPAENGERLNDGKTLLVNVGQKGKYVVVVGMFPDADPTLRYQRISLDHHWNGPARPMYELIEDEFQGMLKSAGIVEGFPRHDPVGGVPGARFVGAEACKSCHPGTVAKWATTKHAHAFEDLVKDPKGLRGDHQFDAECVSCHTTGFEYNSGWKSAELTPYLKGNQCENCHGPASKHAENPDDPAARKAIALNAADANRNGLCIRCHDGDNSPKFDFITYWGQVAHKGLDTYDGPKVHQGAAASAAAKGAP